MKRNLFALHGSDVDELSLVQLARAITYAPRKDNLPVRRAFVRTRAQEVVREVRTQRIRIRFDPHARPLR